MFAAAVAVVVVLPLLTGFFSGDLGIGGLIVGTIWFVGLSFSSWYRSRPVKADCKRVDISSFQTGEAVVLIGLVAAELIWRKLSGKVVSCGVLNSKTVSGSGSSTSSDQSSTKVLLCFRVDRRLIAPPIRAELGISAGIGIPAFFAETSASSLENSSLSCRKTCQSSSPALESRSERAERRDEIESRCPEGRNEELVIEPALEVARN